MTAKAKFRIEGEDATAAAFRSALGNAQSTANRMSGLFKAAFAGVSISAITRVAMNAIEMGDELNKAAIKAGIGGKAISELAHAAKMADVDLAGLSNSLRFMQKNLSEAGTGAKAPLLALKALGLELKDLKGLAADRQFEVLADRISQLKDPADKARAATELFGRAGADLLPMFEQGAAGIRKAREEAEKLGKSFSDEQIQKLAQVDDEVKKLRASWEGFAATLTVKVSPAIRGVLGLLQGELPKADLQTQIANIEYQLSFMEQSFAKGTLSDKRIERLYELRSQLAQLQEQVSPYEDFAARRSRAMAGAGADLSPGYEAAAAKEATSSFSRDSAQDDYYASRRALDDQITEDLKDSAEETADIVDKMFKDAMGDVMDHGDAVVDEMRKNLEEQQELAEEHAAAIKGIFDDGIFLAFEDGADAMLKYWADTLKKMAIQAAATEFFNMGGGGVGSFFSGLFGFASGGRPPVGRPSIVGERGPELFVPDGTGTIIPNHKLGGSQVVQHISIDARGSSVESVKLMQQTVPAIIRQAVNQARMAFMDDLSRGVRA